MARKKTSKSGSGWSWRLAGIALCAFFALGVITGLSQSGRLLARRVEALLHRWPPGSRSELIPAAYHTLYTGSLDGEDIGPSSPRQPAHIGAMAIALVERSDDFYELDSHGALHGPISPGNAGDLPILSGPAVAGAEAAELLEYAGQAVRAEAVLSAIVSEMHIEASGRTTFFLERPPLAIVIASGQVPIQLARAARVLGLWRGRRESIAQVDMTTADQAIVTPRIAANDSSAVVASRIRNSAMADRAGFQARKRLMLAAGAGAARVTPRSGPGRVVHTWGAALAD